MSIEKLLERKLREAVKLAGGIALKFHCLSFTGMPDRMVLLPGARIYFVELKDKGKAAKDRQALVHRMLQKLGFEVLVIDTELKLQEFIALC